MDAKKIENLSIEEYIEIEIETDSRYEYHDGTIIALAGGSVEHGLKALINNLKLPHWE